MAGSISISMSQQFNELGAPLSGGYLYTIEAGTTSTPQNAYQDSGLTIPLPNPIVLDQAGRVPQFYLADGSIKIRLTDSAGVQQLVADNILVIGPSSGGGGGGAVDATTVLATGDVKARYGTGTLSGFVRCNGRTIGSSTSGATERANADAQQLFEYLYGADVNLVVSGGRGASANADWTSNKTITLPDLRGRVIAGLDDMGNTAAGRLGGFGSGSIVLGAAGGQQTSTLVTANLPPYTPSGSISNGAITISHNANIRSDTGASGPGGVGVAASGSATITASQATSGFTGTAQGGTSTPVSILQPMALMTIYVKL
jgi:hypothetical protein